ncbi:MAG: alpha/beta hydrolase [Clostridia bacterium]|nr:alpha/beta hydrolase [Clostridia bacterium]
MFKTETFAFNGYTATVIIPENPNGKWIWKTEFLYAFDAAEQALLNDGYTRVYYSISNKYGSDRAVRLMRDFHQHLIKTYPLCEKATLFGFSRGGLYAFNYALFYPDCVEKVYLDAPVLDLKTWPPKGIVEHEQMLNEYGLNDEALKNWKGNPVDNLEEYFALNIPTLLIAGGADEVVPFAENSKKMIDYCNKNAIELTYIVKPNCKHHPHSLDDVAPILEFVKK